MLPVLMLFLLVFSEEIVSYLNHDSYKCSPQKGNICIPSVFADSG